MKPLQPMAAAIAELLCERDETVVVCETMASGLVSALLLSILGASRYYTGVARSTFLEIELADHPGVHSSSEPYAQLIAETLRQRLGTTWASKKPERPAPGAMSAEMSQATPASPLPAPRRTSRRWRPVSKTGKRICGCSPSGRWQCSSRCCGVGTPAEPQAIRRRLFLQTGRDTHSRAIAIARRWLLVRQTPSEVVVEVDDDALHRYQSVSR